MEVSKQTLDEQIRKLSQDTDVTRYITINGQKRVVNGPEHELEYPYFIDPKNPPNCKYTLDGYPQKFNILTFGFFEDHREVQRCKLLNADAETMEKYRKETAYLKPHIEKWYAIEDCFKSAPLLLQIKYDPLNMVVAPILYIALFVGGTYLAYRGAASAYHALPNLTAKITNSLDFNKAIGPRETRNLSSGLEL